MPRFPPRGPIGRLFPRFHGTIKALRLPASIPPHFVSFVWRYHGNASISLSSPRRMAVTSLGFFTRYPQPGMLPWRRQDLPSSWGASIPVCSCSSTPVGQTPLTLAGRSHGPCDRDDKGANNLDHFRGSIAWLSGSLSTYHGVGCPSPRKTRFQVLVRLSWTGFHPQGSGNRFQIYFMSIILLFQAFLTQPRFSRSFG